MADSTRSTPPAPGRPLLSAVLLAVGSELTTGETRDTNSGDLARSLSGHGVEVAWISSLPDCLETVTAALTRALAAADLVVTTGGLGPTPDDLTREAIAAALGEEPAVDPKLERWLRRLFERRGFAFPELNVKQAWLIPSATVVPNGRGTAPGWWVDAADGRVIVALPGPPAEMRPMWEKAVLPRLLERGLGRERLVVTYRLAGIGESAAAALLGEPLLRAANPIVATYAKLDGVDVRIRATAEDGRPAQQIAAPAQEAVLAALGRYVWGRDGDTWPQVLAGRLAAPNWTVALIESGTEGAAARLLGGAAWLVAAETAIPDATPIADLAAAAVGRFGTAIGLAVRAAEAGQDTAVEIAACGPWGSRESRQTVFLGGDEGRRRAAVAAAAFLNGILNEQP
jgi:nicotinamide-nucleotide amidase